MKKITTHLWYDKEAKEAAEFYISAFGDGNVKNITTLSGTPSGEVDIVSLRILDHDFTLISAGPYFKFTPAISFLVTLSTKEGLGELWKKLIEGGSALMEIGEYPFSEKYGWLQDKYGLSWQLIYIGDQAINQIITPYLMFVGDRAGRAEEAIGFYCSVFPDSKPGHIMRYGQDEGPEKEGSVKFATFSLAGQDFSALDSALAHNFTFSEAISFVVNCEDQKEIDYYWEKLSAVPEAEQCGWLKDKFGVSWQIVPTLMEEMMKDKDKEKVARVTEAFLKMKKFDIKALQDAFDGK